MPTMSDHQVSRAIDGIERSLRTDDPDLVRRFQATRRAELATVIAVVSLLAASAVLLTVGLATSSWVAWYSGAIAFLAAFAVDHGHQRLVRRRLGRSHAAQGRLGRARRG